MVQFEGTNGKEGCLTLLLHPLSPGTFPKPSFQDVCLLWLEEKYLGEWQFVTSFHHFSSLSFTLPANFRCFGRPYFLVKHVQFGPKKG